MPNSAVHRLVGADDLLELREAADAVLVAPAGLRDEPLRLHPGRAGADRGRPLADRARHQQLVAEELELVSESLLQLGQGGVALVVQEVHLQPDRRLALAVEREPRVVHPVVVEVREHLCGGQGPGRREEHLVEMRREAHLGGIGHRVERAPLLVLERLQTPQEEESGVRRPAREASGRDRAVGSRVHGNVLRVRARAGVGGVEERLAEAVRRARAGEPRVEEHRPVRHRFVELGPRRHAVLGPLVRVEAAHRRDPCAVGHARTSRGQRFLDLLDRSRVLEDRVVTGPVGEAYDVDVALDHAGDDGAPLQVDRAPTPSARLFRPRRSGRR